MLVSKFRSLAEDLYSTSLLCHEPQRRRCGFNIVLGASCFQNHLVQGVCFQTSDCVLIHGGWYNYLSLEVSQPEKNHNVVKWLKKVKSSHSARQPYPLKLCLSNSKTECIFLF